MPSLSEESFLQSDHVRHGYGSCVTVLTGVYRQEYHRYKAEKLPDETLPHILGLTASPLFNPKDAKREVAVLEANLDAKLVTARESVEEVKGYAMKPRELEHYFSLDGIIPIRLDFEDELEDLEIWEHIDKADKIVRRIDNTKYVCAEGQRQWRTR